MVFYAPEYKIRIRLLEKIRLKGIPLFADPCEGQASGEMHTGGSQATGPQFSPDGGEGEDIVILVKRLVWDKFLVFLPDGVIAALINRPLAKLSSAIKITDTSD